MLAPANTPAMINGSREPTIHGRGLAPRSGNSVGADVGELAVGARVRRAASSKAVGERPVASLAVGIGVGDPSSPGNLDVGAAVSLAWLPEVATGANVGSFVGRVVVVGATVSPATVVVGAFVGATDSPATVIAGVGAFVGATDGATDSPATVIA